MSDDQGHQQERRAHEGLRDVFEDAYVLVSPFFDTANGWGHKPLVQYAQIALREKYPAMTSQEAGILLSALRRVYAERHRASA